MPINKFTPIAPDHFLHVGGFLGQRFQANRLGRLKDPILSEEFIRLHERKNHDGWFWLGEQIGKWLDAAAYTSLIANDTELRNRVHDILGRLKRAQEDDGYLGILERRRRMPVRGMELYEMYYVLHGLLVCHELLGSTDALEMARRLGDYIITTWGVGPGQYPLAGRYPGNGHGGGEGTLILEPIVLLGIQTGEERFITWGESTLRKWDEWLEAHPESRFTCAYTPMKEFAAGKRQVDQLRDSIHAHTFHMTLLGIAALYNATGNQEYREVVLGAVNRLAQEWIFLTGGMSSGEGYVPRRFYHPNGDVEVCPQHTWLLLLDQALRWTGEARYADEIERDLFNHFLAAQLGDGSNWSYMTPLNGKSQEPEGPNCCNASGHRIAGRMPTYLYGFRHGAPAVLLYTESEAVVNAPGLPPVRLRQETEFPSAGAVTLHVNPEVPARFPLHLRIPYYASGASIQIGTDTPINVNAGDFVVLEREWQAGDQVNINLPLPLRVQANNHLAAILRGPLVYAYFQAVQPDPVVYFGRRGRFPADVVLSLDPCDLPAAVTEEPASAGLLGPALRISATVESKAPMFAQAGGNVELPPDSREVVSLLPFANQGSVRGDYAVFMEYKSESH